MTSSGMYLATTSDKRVQLTADHATVSYMKWILTDASDSYTVRGSCIPHRYYIQSAAFPDFYLQGGISSPRLAPQVHYTYTSQLDSEFIIESTVNGYGPCGLISGDCSSASSSHEQCRTGIAVVWTNSTLTPDATQRTNIQSAAQSQCHDHCLNCRSWETNCKSCGGTIDKWMGMESSQSTAHYYRRCDCNSANKIAQTSFWSVIALGIAVAYNRP